MVNTAVTFCGLKLENPIIPASGTFGYGREFAQLYDINLLGSFSFKGTTREERFGNPLPRIAECTGGMINSVGLQNPGIERVIKEELPQIKKIFSNMSPHHFQSKFSLRLQSKMLSRPVSSYPNNLSYLSVLVLHLP